MGECWDNCVWGRGGVGVQGWWHGGVQGWWYSGAGVVAWGSAGAVV